MILEPYGQCGGLFAFMDQVFSPHGVKKSYVKAIVTNQKNDNTF